MQIKKSQHASLEDKKIIYVLMGFVFVLSLCYVALEWTEQEVTKYEVMDTEFLFDEEVFPVFFKKRPSDVIREKVIYIRACYRA